MKVIVLMAGKGSRFKIHSDKNPSYKYPKPFIPVNGKPMVYWATTSLPFIQHMDQKTLNTKIKVQDKDLIFIALKEHQEKFDIRSHLYKWYGKNIVLLLLHKVTRGAAESAYQALRHVDIQEDIIILDADNFYDGRFFYKAIMTKDRETISIFPVFQPQDQEPKWSYALHDKEGVVSAIEEKDPVLAGKGVSAIIGAFYFSKAKSFFDEAKAMIDENDLTGPQGKQEFYMSKVCQRLVKKGKKIMAVSIDKMWSLGTPDDLEYFLQQDHV